MHIVYKKDFIFSHYENRENWNQTIYVDVWGAMENDSISMCVYVWEKWKTIKNVQTLYRFWISCSKCKGSDSDHVTFIYDNHFLTSAFCNYKFLLPTYSLAYWGTLDSNFDFSLSFMSTLV